MTNSDTQRPTKYFNIHYTLLRFLGLGWWHNPGEGSTRNFEGWYLYYAIMTQLIWVAGFVGLETIDPFIGKKDLDRFMFSLSFVITHDLTCIKLYLFFFKNAEFQDIVRTLEIGMYQYYQNNTKNRRTVKITKLMTFIFIFFGWITIGNANISGILQDIRWKAETSLLNNTMEKPPRTLPMPVYIPWNYESQVSYTVTFVLVTVGLLWTGHIVMVLDTFIGSLILHMSSQFSILQEGIENAYDRTFSQLAASMNNDNDPSITSEIFVSDNGISVNEIIVRRHYTEKEVESALTEVFTNCFRQHQLLISCVEKFARTYSLGFMTQLVSSLAAICAVMVQLSHDASTLKSISLITSLSFFVVMIIQLALQCFTGNELTIQAGRVADSVMQCKWELLPISLRRGLLMMMMRAQRSLHLTAAGFTKMDNACFLSILKGAYSYYAVLSQKQE